MKRRGKSRTAKKTSPRAIQLNSVPSISSKILAFPSLLQRQDSEIWPLPSKKSFRSAKIHASRKEFTRISSQPCSRAYVLSWCFIFKRLICQSILLRLRHFAAQCQKNLHTLKKLNWTTTSHNILSFIQKLLHQTWTFRTPLLFLSDQC